MILSAGLTPAWQQICVFARFQPGEVNRAREVVWCASGKVLNAGIGMHHLGGPSLTLSPAGGPAADDIRREFASLGAPLRLIPTRSATRVCTTILDRSSGTMTELVENGRPVTPEELDEFRRAFVEEAARADVVILIGSLPAGAAESYYGELLRETRCPAVLDFRGEGLLGVLPLRPFLVKPNREELSKTVGRSLASDDELLAAMRSLNARGAQWVVVTDGPRPVWMTSARQAYRLHPPRVGEVVNPIGSGDSLAAGIAWATRQGRPPLEAVRLGLAAAGQNLRHLLPCRLNAATLAAEAKNIRVEPMG